MSHKDWTRHSVKLHKQFKEPSYPGVFDCIVIGAGPAGMTAAIYGGRRKMKILIICGHNIGGQMTWSSDIENYTGIKKITGPALTDRFYHHVRKLEKDTKNFDVWMRRDENVAEVKKNKDGTFSVTTDTDQPFTSKTIVITAGKTPRTLGIPGEEIAMQGNGLSFCATCDAPLYTGKKMGIIGGGNSAMDVALQLETLTDDITIFTDLPKLMGEGVLMDKVKNSPAISIKYNTQTKEILLDADNQVRGIRYTENGGEEQEFECEGIFEEIGHIPATKFLKDFEGLKLNEREEIITDRKCRTSLPAVFAAGDVTDQSHKQVIVAAGEGAIAALEAHEFLLNS